MSEMKHTLEPWDDSLVRLGMVPRVDAEDSADRTHPTQYAEPEATIMRPLTGDDGNVYFPHHEDQMIADRLYARWGEFNKHVMQVAGPRLNGPDLQRLSRLAFLHIVGHALAVDRLRCKYEARKHAAFVARAKAIEEAVGCYAEWRVIAAMGGRSDGQPAKLWEWRLKWGFAGAGSPGDYESVSRKLEAALALPGGTS